MQFKAVAQVEDLVYLTSIKKAYMCKEINPERQISVRRKQDYKYLLSFSALLNRLFHQKIKFTCMLLQHSFPPITKT